MTNDNKTMADIAEENLTTEPNNSSLFVKVLHTACCELLNENKKMTDTVEENLHNVANKSQ